MRPILFIILCSMVFLNQFTIEETIVFLGCLTFLFASSKTAISLFTNLLRFYPQLKRYLRFNELSTSAGTQTNSPGDTTAETITFDNSLISGSSKTSGSLGKGHIALCLLDSDLNSLNLYSFLPALLGNAIDDSSLLEKIYFVSSKYRFSTTTILEQLCGGEASDKKEILAYSRCKSAGSKSEFENLKDGFHTQLDEDVWNKLSASARFNLRVTSLSLKDQPNIIVIDESIIKPMGMHGPKLIREWFQDSFIFIISQADLAPNLIEADLYLAIANSQVSGMGDSAWFENQCIEFATNNDRSKSESDLDLALL